MAAWESALLSTPPNMGIIPGRPIKYAVKTMSIVKGLSVR
jgi:hypothetical protein